MTARADLIAQTVLNEFNKLSAKRKPKIRDNGFHEWVPLSGIVAQRDGRLTCLALATGMKCLPTSKIAEVRGVAVHDWHAEVLAIRAFNRYLLDECRNVHEHAKESEIVLRSQTSPVDAFAPPFRIRDGVQLHMYCSEAPCGDASMELVMAAQDDATPWAVPTAVTDRPPEDDVTLAGRGYFSQLGIVRRKPARNDAPPTLSKSCSDKLALKQCTSLLSSLTSLFIAPDNAYISTMVLPKSQHSHTGCQRAFSDEGRMKPLSGKRWSGGYLYRPFSIETTDLEFEYSKRTISQRSDKISASPLAAVWTATGTQETILGGIIQGRKAYVIQGASKTSRRQMWLAARELANQREREWGEIYETLNATTYHEIKECGLLASRRQARGDTQAISLSGWVRNAGDSDFTLDA